MCQAVAANTDDGQLCISPTQSKAPDAAGRLNDDETATLSEENEVSTVTVKLRGVLEEVKATGAVMAALAMPGEKN
jgi:hypothetical protein